jgi:photosystem II stability/assembly factor-like uncharacterized protein
MTKLTRILKSISISILVASTLPAIANERAPSYSSDLAHKRLLTEVTLKKGKLVAVGERGHIITSTDGKTWQQAKVPVDVLLTSVSFKNESVGFAVGHDSTILKTKDGGDTWSLLNFQPELDRPLLAVQALNNHVVAVGAYGAFWQSDDGGESWKSIFHDGLLLPDDKEYLDELKVSDPEQYKNEQKYLLPHFNDLLLTNSGWYLTGEAGFLAKSIDFGVSWQKIDTNYFGSFFAIDKLAEDAIGKEKLVVAGLRGNVFRQGDDSKLVGQKLVGNATINDIFSEDKLLLMFANSGNFYYSIDNQQIKHHIFEDGKAVMSGVVFKDLIIFATEAGIKTLPLSQFK